MWIGIPARVCARRPVRPRVARALFLDATVAPPVANACARCASIVVVVVVVDCRRRARLEGSASRRAGGHRVWANSQIARRGATVSYAYTVRTRGRSVAVGRRDRVGASTRATPRTATRDRDRDARLDAREPAARETTRRSVANRESRIANRARVAREKRETRATLGFHAPARRARDDARESDGASARRRSARARDRAASSRARARRRIRAKRSREARDRATTDGRGRSCGCTFPRVVTRRIRDSDPPGFGADSVPIRGRWRCDGWSPCRSSAKRARA